MKEMLCNSVFFGVMVSILAYEIGMFLKRNGSWQFLIRFLYQLWLSSYFCGISLIMKVGETGAHLLSYFLDACNSLPGDSAV